MSTNLELEGRTRTFSEVVAPLLKEYSCRLQTVMDSLTKRVQDYTATQSHWSSAERSLAGKLLEIERTRFKSLLPGIERLARQTSQELEHGMLDEYSRIELEARLADLEGLLSAAKQVQEL